MYYSTFMYNCMSNKTAKIFKDFLLFKFYFPHICLLLCRFMDKDGSAAICRLPLNHVQYCGSKTQSGTADFTTSAATWRTIRNIRVGFDYGLSLHYMKTWRHTLNRMYITYCVVVRGETSHGHRLHVQKIWWNFDCGFRDMRANRQTNKHTRWSRYFASLPGTK